MITKINIWFQIFTEKSIWLQRFDRITEINLIFGIIQNHRDLFGSENNRFSVIYLFLRLHIVTELFLPFNWFQRLCRITEKYQFLISCSITIFVFSGNHVQKLKKNSIPMLCFYPFILNKTARGIVNLFFSSFFQYRLFVFQSFKTNDLFFVCDPSHFFF